MTEQILNRRSSLLYDRPLPTRLGTAEIVINNNPGEPGLYFADNIAAPNTGLIKVGPTFVGSTAPNLSPTGYTSLSKGEQWLDTASTQVLKINDGTTWQIPKAVASIGTSKPSNPNNGQLHFDKTVSKLYIYDSSTSSWLPT